MGPTKPNGDKLEELEKAVSLPNTTIVNEVASRAIPAGNNCITS